MRVAHSKVTEGISKYHRETIHSFWRSGGGGVPQNCSHVFVVNSLNTFSFYVNEIYTYAKLNFLAIIYTLNG